MLATIILSILIVAVVALIVHKMLKDRRAGKSPCGGNCQCCGACQGCAQTKEQGKS